MIRFQFDELAKIFSETLSPFSAGALLTPEGDALALSPLVVSDLGTLPSTLNIVLKYTQLSPGEIVLMNDPYSGGSTLATMTLVQALCLLNSKNQPDAYLVTRIPFKPTLTLADSVDGEGLRIPPTPILIQGVVNEDLLGVISQHPSCPQHFSTLVQSTISKMKSQTDFLCQRLHQIKGKIEKNWSRSFLKSAETQTAILLETLNNGELKTQKRLEDQTLLKLFLQKTEEGISFDFSGSGVSPNFFLTDAATLGACAGALCALIGKSFPLTQGLLNRLQVMAPKGSMLNCKYPAPVSWGHTDGVEIVAGSIYENLYQVCFNQKPALGGRSLCSYEIEFSGNRKFYDFLFPGAPATANSSGCPGVSLWRRSRLSPSIEEIERRFPLVIRNSGIRSKSGGTGKFRGGEGLSRSIEILEEGSLRWRIAEANDKPLGAEGGKAGVQSEISVQNKSQKISAKLPSTGEEPLSTGSSIRVHSAGGGGFGEFAPVLPEDEDL